ncbi:MGH1-like glycoside hydrolase domain-containing protein [Mycolicibacterium palauense]|uniref:MGH1-like glycoside hydrolase domain-containing protein n=1 Tax=Mycolicibacterium palauense TaxID=2034511 RepID=UPI000BFED13E|nr:glucosidase [Mycolicibacterium palauense]
MSTAERHRLDEAENPRSPWRRWGTYLSERAWGTVREDYSADGDAWSYFPFEDARSRAYRWSEDGLAGWCDDEQTICLGVALWNGRDKILKERPYGVANEQGNHGEDAKDYWFYTDNLPTHAYASMVYKYPQAAFPYDDLLHTNQQRGPEDDEYELFDALREQWLSQRYFDICVTYAKDGPEDVYCRITATNRGPDAAEIHVLPQLWYRNTWSWDPRQERPRITACGDGTARTWHPKLGHRWISVTAPGWDVPSMLFCENETNNRLLFGSANASPTTKDGIGDHVVDGVPGAVNTETGSKVAADTTAMLQPGETLVVTVRFATSEPDDRLSEHAERVLTARKAEADEFYADIAAEDLTDDERLVQRQALAGLLWCKQYYSYSVRRWLKGDPGQPAPPSERWNGRNNGWQHFAVSEVVMMPDAWEYPWFAAWDLAFHCVTMALIDPEFAKAQIQVLQQSTAQHPHGQLPAYEWKFGDTNPPLHAWAAWHVYQLDRLRTGVGDQDFLANAYRSSTLNAMWWLNQKDDSNRGVFGGGFLGMDNIGVFDRDEPLPTGGRLAQVDGTAWMAALVIHLLEMAIELSHQDPSYAYMFSRWVWDAWLVANVLEKGTYQVSFWNADTEFYHDVIELPDGSSTSLEVFSIQAVVPLFAAVTIPAGATEVMATVRDRLQDLARIYEHTDDDVRLAMDDGDASHFMVAVVHRDRLTAILRRLLDPEQFFSPYGIRSLSRYHRDNPYRYRVNGADFIVDYQPAESRSRMFGGNSNWRGPIWLPTNFLVVQALDSYSRHLGDAYRVQDPTGSGEQVPLDVVADRLARQLSGLLVRDDSGRRAVFGDNDYFQNDPHWRDLVPFYEYFDGDTGRGLGASHQTGWTATVALLLQFRGRLHFDRDRSGHAR